MLQFGVAAIDENLIQRSVSVVLWGQAQACYLC